MTLPSSFGPYQIFGELARGGQGVVLKARHTQLGQMVAIKILLDPDPNNILRFKQEARILSRLNHPNLLRVLDLGLINGQPYLTMEFIEGDDLKTLVTKNGVPPFPWTINVMRIIGNAVEYINQHSIIHRDIKPGNILIERQTQRPILVDFGLVKRDPSRLELGSLTASRLSQSGEVLGTPTYMAPEQVDKDMGTIDSRTDVYGLGGVLFYLLTGRTPYNPGETTFNIMNKLLSNKPSPDPREFNPAIPGFIANGVNLALQKDQDQRPPNAAEFVKLLEEPRPLSRASSSRRKRLPRRRKKSWLLPAALSVGLSFSGLVTYLIAQGYSPKEAKAIANQEIPSSPVSSLSSSQPIYPGEEAHPAEINLAEAVRMSEEGDFIGCINICEGLIGAYPEEPMPYAVKANASALLADGLIKQQQAYSNSPAKQKIMQRAESYYRQALDGIEKAKEMVEVKYTTAPVGDRPYLDQFKVDLETMHQNVLQTLKREFSRRRWHHRRS